MRLFLKVVLSLLIVFILVGAGGMFFLNRGLDKGMELTINDVNLSSVRDGVYTGVYDGGRWSNEVKVTVEDHKIVKVDVVNDILFKREEITETMIDKVIEEQNTNIDVVSGATVSCKAYLKSIENALNSGSTYTSGQ